MLNAVGLIPAQFMASNDCKKILVNQKVYEYKKTGPVGNLIESF